MKFKTRLTALMLLLSIVLACLVSCTSGNGPEDTLPTDQSGNVSDTLPENNAGQFETRSAFDIIADGKTSELVAKTAGVSKYSAELTVGTSPPTAPKVCAKALPPRPKFSAPIST